MTTVQFPREPDDALYEYLAEKARVCGGGADGIWEGLCTRFALPEVRRFLLPADRESRVYLAGPMTGIEEYNFPAFNATAEQMRANGWHVENPADHGLVADAEWADYLRHDLGSLASCKAIMLLPGWSNSRGARLEVSIAKELGLLFMLSEGAEPVPVPQKYDDTLLPFLTLMRAELHANSHKGDREAWLRMTLENALDEIRHHADKLIVPVMNHDREAIREHAADVANCAMMLADIAGVLSRE